MAERSLVDLFLRPESVALVGASDDPSKIGGRPLRYCLEAGYGGQLFPVNPNRKTVQGLPAYATVSDIPSPPSLAVIAVPRKAVLAAVDDCIRVGTPAIVVFSAGFAELDATGARLQSSLVALAAESGTRIVGPNANGVFATDTGFFGLFSPVLERGRPSDGDTAIVTQSAAVGTSLLDLMRIEGFGLRQWVHVGNESDVTLVEFAHDIVANGDIRNLVLAFESLRDADALPELVREAGRRDVRVIAFQAGFSATARAAAASHTGVLTTTSPALVRDVLLQSGAVVASTFRDTVRALAEPVCCGDDRTVRAAVLTSSGGFGVLAADVLARAGVELPTLSDTVQGQLRQIAPYCHPANPVDTTAQIINDPGSYGRLGSAVASSGEVDIVVTFLPHPGLDDTLTQELIAVAREAAGDCAFVAIGPTDGATAYELRRQEVAVGAEPADLAHLLAGSVSTARQARKVHVDHAHVTNRDPVDIDQLAAASDRGMVGELDAKGALSSMGIRVVPDIEARTAQAATAAAHELGGRVAVKLHAPGVSHKAALGGVELGLREPEVAAAAERILGVDLPDGRGRAAAVLVEPMLSGVEAFLGVSRTPDFGVVVVTGLGGTGVEDSPSVAYALPPVTADDVLRMVTNSGLLSEVGARHRDALICWLVSACQALTTWFEVAGRRLRTVEVNPLMVTPHGDCVAVDALVELETTVSAGRVAEERVS